MFLMSHTFQVRDLVNQYVAAIIVLLIRQLNKNGDSIKELLVTQKRKMLSRA